MVPYLPTYYLPYLCRCPCVCNRPVLPYLPTSTSTGTNSLLPSYGSCAAAQPPPCLQPHSRYCRWYPRDTYLPTYLPTSVRNLGIMFTNLFSKQV